MTAHITFASLLNHAPGRHNSVCGGRLANHFSGGVESRHAGWSVNLLGPVVRNGSAPASRLVTHDTTSHSSAWPAEFTLHAESDKTAKETPPAPLRNWLCMFLTYSQFAVTGVQSFPERHPAAFRSPTGCLSPWPTAPSGSSWIPPLGAFRLR